jgi:2-polyprenyl-3-methyl-5-hydroxy-6-metoxy-1,4-benzoquinol methylase
MTLSSQLIGVQQNGSSPDYTKRMAFEAIERAVGNNRLGAVADIGGGRGELAQALASRSENVLLVDYSPPDAAELPANVKSLQADLNSEWPIESGTIDFAFALEVIEHVENPRHFFREMKRVVKPGGYIFITTPNNHCLASKITFLLRGQHRYFQAPSYPAHITPLLVCDFERMAAEAQLSILNWSWSNYDTIPRLHWRVPLRGWLFSNSMGVLIRKPASLGISCN